MSIPAPLKWHGGKVYLADRVLQRMPPHLYYVEPYFGSGQVLFARDPRDPRLWWTGLTSDKRVPKGVIEVVNDLHSNLMNFYAVLKDPATYGQLQHRLSLTLESEDEWNATEHLLACADGDPVERAAALFTRCRLSLSARMDCYAPPVRNRVRGGRGDSVNAWWGAIRGLEAVHQRLMDVKVLNRPALDVIRSEDTPATLFYLDPPYYHPTRASKKVYDHEMTERDHRELLDVLLATKGKVILSGYANDLYDGKLSGWIREEFDLPNNAAGGKKKRRMIEVLWCNFQPPVDGTARALPEKETS
jgi:DNA adenine methylase